MKLHCLLPIADPWRLIATCCFFRAHHPALMHTHTWHQFFSPNPAAAAWCMHASMSPTSKTPNATNVALTHTNSRPPCMHSCLPALFFHTCFNAHTHTCTLGLGFMLWGGILPGGWAVLGCVAVALMADAGTYAPLRPLSCMGARWPPRTLDTALRTLDTALPRGGHLHAAPSASVLAAQSQRCCTAHPKHLQVAALHLRLLHLQC